MAPQRSRSFPGPSGVVGPGVLRRAGNTAARRGRCGNCASLANLRAGVRPGPGRGPGPADQRDRDAGRHPVFPAGRPGAGRGGPGARRGRGRGDPGYLAVPGTSLTGTPDRNAPLHRGTCLASREYRTAEPKPPPQIVPLSMSRPAPADPLRKGGAGPDPRSGTHRRRDRRTAVARRRYSAPTGRQSGQRPRCR